MSGPTPEAVQAALTFLAQFLGQSSHEPTQNTPQPGPGATAALAHARQTRPAVPAATKPLTADLALTESNLLLQIDLPGLTAGSELALRLLTPTELLVEAWLQPPPGLPLLSEIPTGMQSRLFQLPAPVIGSSLVTRYQDGILTLTFARAPA